jgi:hypothetical protein
MKSVTKKIILEKCSSIQGNASGINQVSKENFNLVKGPFNLHKYTETGAVLFNQGGHLICEFKPEYKSF